MAIEEGDRVTFEYVGRLEDGTVFDTSRESVAETSGLAEENPDREFAPLTVELGEGRIVEGLEDGLVGLDEDASETITVQPQQGYGERSAEYIEEFEPAAFEEVLQGGEVEEGVYVQSEHGDVGEIVHAGPDLVRVDFNHALAGKTIEFEVDVVDVE